MEGAILSIELKDQSSPAGSPGATSQGAATPVTDPSTLQQLQAITAQGGAGAKVQQVPTTPPVTVPVTPAPPSPATGASVGGPTALAGTVQQILAADPKATAAEVAKLLGGGMTEGQAQKLMASSTPTSTAKPTDDDLQQLIRRERISRMLAADEEARAARQEQEERVRQQEAEIRRRPPPLPLAEPPLPPMFAAPPELTREQRLEEAARRAPPVLSPAEQPSAIGAQNAVNAIASLASREGPIGGAVGQFAGSVAAIPGAGTSLAAAAPVLASAAPYIAAATAALAVPSAVAYTLNRAGESSRSLLEGISPLVSMAEAQAEVRQLLANFRSAAARGQVTAEFIERRSQLGATFQGLGDITIPPALAQFNSAISLFDKAVQGYTNLFQYLDGSPILGGLARGSFGVLGFLDKIDSFVDWLAGNKAKDDLWKMGTGLQGIIPQRPSLPAPFTNANQNSADLDLLDKGLVQTIQIPGLGF